MPTEAELLVATLTTLRTASPAMDVKNAFKEANAAFYRVQGLERRMQYLADRMAGSGTGRESVAAFKERVQKDVREIVAAFRELDLKTAQTALDKAEAATDAVFNTDAANELETVREEFAGWAELVYTDCDKLARDLRDIEMKHPEIGGYQFDQLVRGVESMADDAFETKKEYTDV